MKADRIPLASRPNLRMAEIFERGLDNRPMFCNAICNPNCDHGSRQATRALTIQNSSAPKKQARKEATAAVHAAHQGDKNVRPQSLYAPRFVEDRRWDRIGLGDLRARHSARPDR